MLYDPEGNLLCDLGALEPYCYNVDGKPIRSIEYKAGEITIKWFTGEASCGDANAWLKCMPKHPHGGEE